MGKRSGTLETTLLAIELLRRIPRGRKVTAETLRSKLFSFEDVILLSQKSRVALFDSIP